jgi:nucleotide-binding universal stress UspA family protein
MPIKTILVYLPSEHLAEPVLKTAIALAGPRDAHVVGLHLQASYYPAYGEVAIAMPPDVIEQMRKPLRERAEKLKETFNARMAEAGVSAEWRSGTSEYSALPGRIVAEAVSSDLVLCPKIEAEEVDVTTLDLPERLILEGGRPVLVVPPEADTLPPKRVLIAWNNSPQSARAVFDALDLMSEAAAVTVLTIAGDEDARKQAESDAGKLAANLKRHGIDAKVDAVAAGHSSASDYLMERVNADGADLLVMGCYGHSRFRELVFGGVTRRILGSVKVPTLMSH